MTQQEFETRTGLNVTATEYEYIERIYMAAGSIDKDSFCNEIKDDKRGTLRSSNIVCTIVMENELQKATIKTQLETIRRQDDGMKQFTDQMVDFLILQAEKWSASDLREKAIKLVGIKEYIRRRLDMTLGLWEDDRNALLEILK